MKRKSARPSFSRRPSFNKREKTDKGGRIRQRNQRLALLVLLLLLVVTGMVILMVRNGQKQEESAETSQEMNDHTNYGPEEWMSQGAPYIDVQLLTPNEYSRPQLPLNGADYIAIHYTANPGATAQNNRDYFENLSISHEAKVSSHFVVGLEGEVIQCIPTSEMSYATNSRNVDSISIECCHKDDTGVFEQETYDSVVKLAAWLCARFGLTSEQVIRHYDVTGKEYTFRVIGLLVGMVICMIVFYKNQRNRAYRRTFLDLFREFDLKSARSRWYVKLTLIVSSAMLFMNLLGLPRAMWAGIACMSVCLPFTEDCIPRSVSRGMFNVVGCLLFIVLYLVLPKSMYPYIGMIGGIGVGYSAGYPWQTAFNTFGALSIAAGIFGMPAAIALRIGANVLGAAYTVICNKVTDKVAEYIGTNKCAENLS